MRLAAVRSYAATATTRSTTFGRRLSSWIRRDLPIQHYDEVWLYNVLQHVGDPAKVVANAVGRLAQGGCLRLFEWINIPADDCHPHVLTPDGILNWLCGCRIEKVGLPHLKEFWSDATAFTGIFKRSL